MNVYLEIMRPGNAVMAVIAVFLVMFISGNFTLDAFLACLAVFIVTGGGNAINDYFDHKIDAINKPKRPIPSGRISLKVTRIYSLSLFAIGTIIGFITGILPGIIVFLSSILMIYYAYSLKKKPFIGNFTVSLLTGLTFVFGSVVVNEPLISIVAISPFFITMMREIVKDIEDIKGDKKERAKTMPIVYGLRSSAIIAAVSMILCVVISPIPSFIGVLTIFYLPVLIIGDTIFVLSGISIVRDHSIENAIKVSKRVKIGMLVILMSYAVGSPFLMSLF